MVQVGLFDVGCSEEAALRRGYLSRKQQEGAGNAKIWGQVCSRPRYSNCTGLKQNQADPVLGTE